MGHFNEYVETRERAKRKEKNGNPLKKSEQLALSGKWYYSFSLSEEAIQAVLKLSEEFERPSDLVELLIFKEAKLRGLLK